MKRFYYYCYVLFLLMTSTVVYAGNSPLPNDAAFRLSASLTSPSTLTATWVIAPNYHLYRDRIKIKTLQRQTITLGHINIPKGQTEQDEILGKYQAFRHELRIPIPLLSHTDMPFELLVTYQGCADSGFCYPPTTKRLVVNPAEPNRVIVQNAHRSDALSTDDTQKSEHDTLTQLLINQNFLITLASFFGFGLLLAFTPCVFPMIPILTGIIVGQGQQLNTRKAFFLSLTYVLSMALTYAIAGVIAAFIGSSLQSAFQSAWILTIFSGLFVLLACSLLGHYELRLPQGLQHRLIHLSNRQRGGSYVGVAIMGCLATLIVSPCVSAPLVGALSYIGQTGNAFLGGMALFSLGLGSGLPLLLIGTSSGRWLPKAGAWMEIIKKSLGILLLGVAISLLDRILPARITMLLWGLLLLIAAIYLGIFLSTVPKLRRSVGGVFAVYGLVVILGASLGNTDPLSPLANLSLLSEEKATPLAFRQIRSLPELQQALRLARREGKTTLLDFSADWCISCKKMLSTTFSDHCVKKALDQTVLLQVDLAQNNLADQRIQTFFHVIAPPTILLFDKAGQEQRSQRIIGERSPQEFLHDLQITSRC